jgi:hypothetical protein
MINDYLPFTRLDSTLLYLSNLNERTHPRHQTKCWTVRSQLRRSPVLTTRPRHHLPSLLHWRKSQNSDTNKQNSISNSSLPSDDLSSLAQGQGVLRLWDSLSRWNSWRCVALRRGKRVNQIQHRPSILRPWISSAPVFDFSLSLSDRFPSDSALFVSFRFSFFFFVRI